MTTVGFYGGKFSPLHLGHVRTAMIAAQQVDELHIAVITDENWEREHLYKGTAIKFPSIEQRVRWWREVTKGFHNIFIHSAHQPDTGNSDEDWATGATGVWEAIGKPIDKVFSSEPSYTQFFERFYPSAEHVIIDADRSFVSISSTTIRKEGVLATWDFLPKPVQRFYVKKVALVGAESCGKSTLTHQLSTYYNTVSVEEYGRDYMYEVNDTYTLPEDYPIISAQHFLNVQRALGTANKILFVDTDATVTQNFAGMYNNFTDKVTDAFASIQEYDLILFLDTDVKWVNDGTRVFGNKRSQARDGLISQLEKYNQHYHVISGSYAERFNKAVALVEELV